MHDHRLAEAEKLYLESYASVDKAVGKPEQAAPYAAILPAGFVTSQEAAARAGRP